MITSNLFFTDQLFQKLEPISKNNKKLMDSQEDEMGPWNSEIFSSRFSLHKKYNKKIDLTHRENCNSILLCDQQAQSQPIHKCQSIQNKMQSHNKNSQIFKKKTIDSDAKRGANLPVIYAKLEHENKCKDYRGGMKSVQIYKTKQVNTANKTINNEIGLKNIRRGKEVSMERERKRSMSTLSENEKNNQKFPHIKKFLQKNEHNYDIYQKCTVESLRQHGLNARMKYNIHKKVN